MHDFEYVPKYEWKPVRDELYTIIYKLQNEVRDKFTFQFHFVGSSKHNMITRNRKSNTGFDFDVNLEVNDPNEKYSAKKIRDILRDGLNKITNPYGLALFGYDYTEDSTRVLTMKVKDVVYSRVIYSCDFCIVRNHRGRQEYIHYNKKQNSYTWEFQSKGYIKLPDKIEWIKQQGLWQQVKDRYIEKKNTNDDPDKYSRAIFAETVNEIFQQNR